MAFFAVTNLNPDGTSSTLGANSTAADADATHAVAATIGVLAVSVALWAMNAYVIKPTTIKIDAAYVPLAGLVIAAAALERLLEPLSRVLLPADTQQATADQTKTHAIAQSQDPTLDAQAVQPSVVAAADAKAQLLARKADRALAFWVIASTAGMLIAACFGFYLLGSVATTPVNVYFDITITGLAIGAGTKPLHDLITSIQAKAATSAP